MGRNLQIMKVERDGETHVVEFKWTISKGRDTYGYNICTAFVDGEKVGKASGGGYDMQGASLDDWMSEQAKPEHSFYGLRWETPKGKRGKEWTPEYQSKVWTENHTAARIDGGCGMTSLLRNLGFEYQWLRY